MRAVKTSRKNKFINGTDCSLCLTHTQNDHPAFYSNSSELLIALHAHYRTDLGQDKIKVSKQPAERS